MTSFQLGQLWQFSQKADIWRIYQKSLLDANCPTFEPHFEAAFFFEIQKKILSNHSLETDYEMISFLENAISVIFLFVVYRDFEKELGVIIFWLQKNQIKIFLFLAMSVGKNWFKIQISSNKKR